MGILRTLLAISVVFTHSYGLVFVGGVLAVQLFYIISGFLISYVLVEARTYDSKLAFYKNRCLRLFPVYWVVAIASVFMFAVLESFTAIKPSFFEVYANLDWVGRFSLIISNIFLLGQDLIMFTGVRDGNFQFVSDFNESEVTVYQGLAVPQAWTLGIELSFYLIAPFVLTKRKWLLRLLVVSLLVKGFLFYLGIGQQDPWSYRFLPAELSFFLLGSLSHQVWKPAVSRRGWVSAQSSIWITGGIVLYCVVYFLLPFYAIKTLSLICLVILALPFLFEFQRNNKLDRMIGELSYPIYISHFAVILPVSYIFKRLHGQDDYRGIDAALTIVALTIITSIILNHYVSRRVDQLRANVKARQRVA